MIDENVPAAVGKQLATEHDVISVQLEMPGASDHNVAKRAISQNRILVTSDLDFAELVFRENVIPSQGVVLLRLAGATPEQITAALFQAMPHLEPGVFHVISKDRLRKRPFVRKP